MQPNMGFFTRFFNSIKGFKTYKYALTKPLGNAVLYLFIISIIFGGILSLRTVFVFNFGVNHMIESLNKNIPDFRLHNGELSLDSDKPFIFQPVEKSALIVDTSGRTSETVLDKYDSGLLLLRDQAIYKKNQFETKRFGFFLIRGVSLDKHGILKWIPLIKVIGILIAVFSFFAYLFGKIFSTLMLSLCGLIIRSLEGYKISYGNIYKISIYALTLPMVLKVIIEFFGIAIPFFFVIYHAIAILYIWMTINKLKKEEKEVVYEIISAEE